MADDSDASDAGSDASSEGGARVPSLKISPFEVRFSQRKMRNVFMDGNLIADTAELVRGQLHDPDDAELYDAKWSLEAPFPPIEVLRWRCKLRDDATGRPLTDPRTGKELYDSEECWFTLDNRRLYCLQLAATKLWPERCTVAVIAMMPKGQRRLREIRKFRTMDSGKSISVGSVPDGVPFTLWSWREELKRITANGGKTNGNAGGKSGKKGNAVKNGYDVSPQQNEQGKGSKGQGRKSGKAKKAESYEDWYEEDNSWSYDAGYSNGKSHADAGYGKGKGGGDWGGKGGKSGKGGGGKRGGKSGGKTSAENGDASSSPHQDGKSGCKSNAKAGAKGGNGGGGNSKASKVPIVFRGSYILPFESRTPCGDRLREKRAFGGGR
eukprot:TRINITY_DN19183_c0_g5_i2.p1 TRINITY_DN19183_c0_g5~~TRINITY_DN19183_c0_g5_i2.p1  ORF type:complete len:381 (-),score=47.94 TRINITY_DN19183_c0_g5_i2:305-1447(-)